MPENVDRLVGRLVNSYVMLLDLAELPRRMGRPDPVLAAAHAP